MAWAVFCQFQANRSFWFPCSGPPLLLLEPWALDNWSLDLPSPKLELSVGLFFTLFYVTGRALKTFNHNVTVTNYPTVVPTPEEELLLQAASRQRKTEIAEISVSYEAKLKSILLVLSIEIDNRFAYFFCFCFLPETFVLH